MSDGPDSPANQLPPTYELPEHAIKRWADIPAESALALRVTKQDLDHLMLGLRRLAVSSMVLGEAFAAHTRGEMQQANSKFVTHQLNIRDGYSDLNRFIEAVMLNANEAGPENG